MSDSENPVQVTYEALKERLSHPFFGVLILMWMLFNWDFLYFLSFDKTDVMTRINEGKEYLNCVDSLLLPLLFTSFYVLVAPRVKLWCRKYEREVSLEDKQDADDSEIKSLYSKERLLDNAVRQKNSELQEILDRIQNLNLDRVRSESELKVLQQKKFTLEQTIKDLYSFSNSEWSFEGYPFHVGYLQPVTDRQKHLDKIRWVLDKFDKVKKLEYEFREKYRDDINSL